MKICLLFFVFSALLFAQTPVTKQKLPKQANSLQDNFLVQKKVADRQIFSNNESNKLFSLNELGESLAMVQTNSLEDSVTLNTKKITGKVFSKECLIDAKKAGNSLEWSFYLKYIANGVGLIGTFVDYNEAGSNENDKVLYNIGQRSSFMNILSFGSTALEIHSLNNIGRAGSSLQSMSSKLSIDKSYLLKEAAGDLKRSRNFGLISAGLGMIGGTAMVYGLSHHIESKTFSKGMVIGGSFGLSSFILKIISINNIADAGETASQFSKNLTDERQKRYFNGFGKGLQNYNKHWKTGVNLTILGVTFMMLPIVVPEPTVARVTVITGALSILAGNIYMNWVAPYSLGEAGDNLSKLEDKWDKD